MLEGLEDKTITLSQKAMASAISCVTRITLLFSLDTMLNTSSLTAILV